MATDLRKVLDPNPSLQKTGLIILKAALNATKIPGSETLVSRISEIHCHDCTAGVPVQEPEGTRLPLEEHRPGTLTLFIMLPYVKT